MHTLKIVLGFLGSFCFSLYAIEAAPIEGAAIPPKIAYLSWGSLATNPGSLPLVEPKGFNSNPRQGPVLPVEYARKMNDGRLTLVIAPGFGKKGQEQVVNEFKSFYATYDGTNVSQARSALQAREGTSADNIGYIDLQKNTYRRKDYNASSGRSSAIEGSIGDDYYTSQKLLQNIVDWAKSKGYAAVVWTDLTPTFTKSTLTLENLKAHLDSLEKDDLKKAYCYLSITPEIRQETHLGNALMAYAADRLTNFFDVNLQDMIPNCIDILYLTR